MAAKVKKLLQWCKLQCEGYSNLNVTNFTSSWKSGLAFCAIIHRYRPDLIDYHSLKEDDTYSNSKLAFEKAESLGIAALLDADDMVEMTVPDKLCIITYVSQYYNYFHDKPKDGGPDVNKFSKNIIFKKDLTSDEKRLSLSNINENIPNNTKRLDSAAKRGTLEDKCHICRNKVYLLERLYNETHLYHRQCFRQSEKGISTNKNKENNIYRESNRIKSLIDTNKYVMREQPGDIDTKITNAKANDSKLSTSIVKNDLHLRNNDLYTKSELRDNNSKTDLFIAKRTGLSNSIHTPILTTIENSNNFRINSYITKRADLSNSTFTPVLSIQTSNSKTDSYINKKVDLSNSMHSPLIHSTIISSNNSDSNKTDSYITKRTNLSNSIYTSASTSSITHSIYSHNLDNNANVKDIASSKQSPSLQLKSTNVKYPQIISVTCASNSNTNYLISSSNFNAKTMNNSIVSSLSHFSSTTSSNLSSTFKNSTPIVTTLSFIDDLHKSNYTTQYEPSSAIITDSFSSPINSTSSNYIYNSELKRDKMLSDSIKSIINASNKKLAFNKKQSEVSKFSPINYPVDNFTSDTFKDKTVSVTTPLNKMVTTNLISIPDTRKQDKYIEVSTATPSSIAKDKSVLTNTITTKTSLWTKDVNEALIVCDTKKADNKKVDSAKADWQIEAEKRIALRNGNYVDPEKNPRSVRSQIVSQTNIKPTITSSQILSTIVINTKEQIITMPSSYDKTALIYSTHKPSSDVLEVTSFKHVKDYNYKSDISKKECTQLVNMHIDSKPNILLMPNKQVSKIANDNLIVIDDFNLEKEAAKDNLAYKFDEVNQPSFTTPLIRPNSLMQNKFLSTDNTNKFEPSNIKSKSFYEPVIYTRIDPARFHSKINNDSVANNFDTLMQVNTNKPVSLIEANDIYRISDIVRVIDDIEHVEKHDQFENDHMQNVLIDKQMEKTVELDSVVDKDNKITKKLEDNKFDHNIIYSPDVVLSVNKISTLQQLASDFKLNDVFRDSLRIVDRDVLNKQAMERVESLKLAVEKNDCNVDVVKRKVAAEEQLSVEEINKQLVLIDGQLSEVEQEGRMLEELIRASSDDTMDEDDQNDQMTQWFIIVRRRFDLVRDEAHLIYRLKQQELEDLHEELEYQVRRLLEIPEEEKTEEDISMEKQLLDELFWVVSSRNNIIEAIEMDRMRYLEEDRKIDALLSLSENIRRPKAKMINRKSKSLHSKEKTKSKNLFKKFSKKSKKNENPSSVWYQL